MSRREKHILLAEPESNQLLNKSKYNDKPEYREKCRALLLNHAGVTIKQVAIHLQVHYVTIGHWIIDWEKEKFDSLACKKEQGSKPILELTNSIHVDLLDKAVDIHRQDVKGIKAELVKGLGKPMSSETVKRFLKKIIIHGGASAVAPIRHKIR